MTISAELFYEKKYDVSQEKNMGGITLLYLMMTGLIGRLVYLMCFRSDYYYKKQRTSTKRERDQSGQREILDARESSGIKQDGMYNLCDPQSD